MHKYVLILAIILLLAFLTGGSLLGMLTGPGSHNFTISLTLEGTENTVYVPGLNPLPATAQGSWPLPFDYYISSQLNNILYALVFYNRYPLSVALKSTPQNHTISLTLETEGSKAFLAFTEGDYQTIANRRGLLKPLGFLNYPSPSFAYGLGLYHPILMLLKNQNLHIPNDFSMQKGYQKITAEYDETTGKVGVSPG